MDCPAFKSRLTNEEIEENFKKTDLFSGIMEGLEEALAYEKGSAKAAAFARKRSLPPSGRRVRSADHGAENVKLTEK